MSMSLANQISNCQTNQQAYLEAAESKMGTPKLQIAMPSGDVSRSLARLMSGIPNPIDPATRERDSSETLGPGN